MVKDFLKTLSAIILIEKLGLLQINFFKKISLRRNSISKYFKDIQANISFPFSFFRNNKKEGSIERVGGQARL